VDIFEIRRRTARTSPYFFSSKTLAFFGQTIQDFSVEKVGDKYHISAPIIDSFGERMGTTVRIFNPETDELETHFGSMK